MTYSSKATTAFKLDTKCYAKKTEVLLIVATIVKAVVIIIFYQHVIDYENSTPQIVPSYGWEQLVSSMYQGKYVMVAQTGLSDIYDLSSRSLRPPIYPALLYAFTRLTHLSTVVLVLFHSIMTSVVAYIGYWIVKTTTRRKKLAEICMWILFIFPMNFLKSGTIDDAPMMLVFLLASVYLLSQYLRNTDKYSLLSGSGVLLGLSTMTRYQTLPIAAGLILYVFAGRPFRWGWKQAIILGFSYSFVLLPWIVRNYSIYGKPILFSGGGGRILLMSQSEEFIKSFPHISPDVIERKYLREYHNSHEYLSKLDAVSLDDEFKRLAIAEAKNYPLKYCRAFVAKLRTFVPYRYYPIMDDILRDIAYVSWYGISLLFFLWFIIRRRSLKRENIIILIVIIGWIVPGLIYFMLSRHLYPVIVLMIIFSFVAHPYYPKQKNTDKTCKT